MLNIYEYLFSQLGVIFFYKHSNACSFRSRKKRFFIIKKENELFHF